MKATSYFGYICPNCSTTIDIGATVGSDKILCPSCKTEMVPNSKGKPVSANVHCSKCNASFGIVNSDKCPICGTPFGS